MSTRKTAITTLALAAATLSAGISAQTARADLTWEHIASLQSSLKPKPLARVKIYNTWTPERHRLLLNYSFLPELLNKAGAASKNSPRIAAMKVTSPVVKNFGSIGFVQRLDDDRVLVYESQSRSIIDEPRRALKERLRFNPWKTLAPELANENPGELTQAQRIRLKTETGALISPLRKRMSKTYFAALPGERTYGTLIGKGYRLTQLVNVGGLRRNQSWMRVTTEWWIAPESGADADARNFKARLQAERDQSGGATNSLWLNEMIALSTIPSDPVARAAWSTFQVPADAPAGAFIGTPLLVTSKVTLPPLQRAQLGDFTMTLRLAERSIDALPASVFAAPTGYKTQDIQPFLKKIDPILDGSAWSSIWDLALSR